MKIAYINFLLEEDNYRAGVLVTDEYTKPIEFRITTNLNLDQLQEILYGEALKEVLYKEKFTIQLLQSLKEDYDIVLVKEKSLLSIRKELEKPVVFIQRYEYFLPLNRQSHKVVNLQEKYDPLYITVSPQDEKRLVSISQQLNEMYRNFNIMEPFDRIEKAIIYLSEKER
ncbi:hypothetical protein [Persephonella sp.]